MRIRLEEVGPYTCLPLPEMVASRPAFRAGQEVELIWDEDHNQVILRGLTEAPTVEAAPGDAPHTEEAVLVDEFLRMYAGAMKCLASIE